MSDAPNCGDDGGRLPALLTVEEAAQHLRIGRTKAYALATEWRVTGGKSGLPVIDLGNVLRVPRHQLELLIGGPLDAPPPGVQANGDERAATTSDPTPSTVVAASVQPPTMRTAEPSVASTPRQRRSTKRQRNRDTAQLSLIDLTSND